MSAATLQILIAACEASAARAEVVELRASAERERQIARYLRRRLADAIERERRER